MTQLDILLVEDDELQRKALYDTLTKWGHTVQACDLLSEAEQLLSKHSFDLALLDMRLPDGDGLGLLEKQSAGAAGPSMVIMTAFADVTSAVSAIKLGAYDYLPKPFENEQLKKIIRNVGNKVELSRRVSSLSHLATSQYEDVWQFDNMIGTGALHDVFEKAQRVATFSDTTVLILGESGTGKGMLAKAIHRLSPRVDQPFIDVNCSAIPGQLIESEIFGHEKGAFTDAKSTKPGLLEVANGGTVFLDEIGDMELNLQSKLLKVIEDKEFRRLGSSRTTRVDVRIIAATNRDLQQMVKDGTFREDLFYRLSVVPVSLPPLREHRTCIRPLADHYLSVFSKQMGRDIDGFAPDAIEAAMDYSWPGNVRELRNAIERSVILSSENLIDADSLGLSESTLTAEKSAGETDGDGQDEFTMPPMSLADCEKRLIASVLETVNGNKNKAADTLKIHRTTLYKKIEEYDLK